MKRICLAIMLILSLVGCSYLRPEATKKKHLEEGSELSKQGKYREASIAYRKALRIDPRFGEAHFRLGQAQVKLGQISRAVTSFQRAAALLPDNIEVQATRGDLYLSAYQGDRQRPKELLDTLKGIITQMEAKAPGSYETLRLSGYVALIDGDLDKVISRFKRANEMKPFQPDVVMPLAETLMGGDEEAEGEQLALQMVEKDPTQGRIYDLLYLYYRDKKRDVAAAEKILLAKVDKNPKVASYLLQLARHYASLNKRAEMDGALKRMLDNPGDFPYARLEAGLFHMQRGHLVAAKRLLEDGVKASPKDKVLYQKHIVALLLLEQKNIEAEQLLDVILRENPKEQEARGTKARLELDKRTPESVNNALHGFQALVTELPENTVYRFNLARAYAVRGSFPEAEKEYREALNRQGDFVLARLGLAELLMDRGRHKEALQQAEEILSTQPKNPEAQLVHASAHFAMGNTLAAKMELGQLLRDQPGFREAHIQMALLHVAEGQFAEAERALKKIYQPGRGDVRVVQAMATLYHRGKQMDKAIQVVTEELKLNQSSEVRKTLAELLAASGQLDAATKEYQQALGSDLRPADTYYRLSALSFTKGDEQNALAYLQKARDRAPRNAPIMLALGSLLERAERGREAQDYYRQVLELEPENAIAMNNLAYNLAQNGGNLDEALELTRKALEKMPNQPLFTDTMGTVFLRKNMADSALGVFRNLVAAYPDNPTYRLHLAEALLQKGDKGAAKRELEAALTKSPGKAEEARIQELVKKAG